MGLGNLYADAFGGGQQPDYTEQNRSNQLYRASNLYANREGETFGQERNLAGDLQRDASGRAPSIAGTQLTQGLDQIQRDANARAAAARGAGGVLARYGAQQTAADAGSQMNSAAALARIQEINQARQRLQQLYGTMGAQSAGLYGTATAGALKDQEIAQRIAQQNQDSNNTWGMNAKKDLFSIGEMLAMA